MGEERERDEGGKSEFGALKSVQMPYGKSDQVSMLCLVGLAVAGLGCAIGGIFQLTSDSGETRNTKVDEYGAAVAYWNAAGRAQFEGVHCTVNNITGSGNYVLPAAISADHLNDPNREDFASYQQLRYERVGSIAPGLTWDSQAKQFAADITLTCQGGAATGASTIVLPSVQVYKTTVQGLANQKQCQYQHKGSYVHNRCEVYRQLKEVCTKLGLVNGRWVQNTTWGGAGCHAARSWTVATYKQVPGSMVSFGHGMPPSGQLKLQELKVVVRSGLDPWLDAEQLTDDTTDFGATPKEELTLGIVLEVLAVLLVIPLAYRCFEIYSHKEQLRERRALASLAAQDHTDDEEEFSNPLTGGAGDVSMDRYPQHSPPDAGLVSTFGGIGGVGRPKMAKI